MSEAVADGAPIPAPTELTDNIAPIDVTPRTPTIPSAANNTTSEGVAGGRETDGHDEVLSGGNGENPDVHGEKDDVVDQDCHNEKDGEEDEDAGMGKNDSEDDDGDEDDDEVEVEDEVEGEDEMEDENDEDADKNSEGGEGGENGEDGEDSQDGEDDEELDIRDELSNILEGDLEFTGTISFSRAYSTAPNPVLDIEGLGIVGLPLSSRDAVAIKACAEQAPFGMADQTVVDKTVRDTWEIDGHKVNFVNAAWQPFFEGVVQDVCQTLGVNIEASKPRCELYKLLLYETGSHFLPHVDTEKVDGMFATIVVALPAKFTGGAVHVSHGDFSETYDHSALSQTDTTILAWYTDVTHEVKPVTSGYRLALSFNLVHTTNSLRPAVSTATDAVVRLRRVLASWTTNDHDAPDKIIYLLNHKYSHASMNGSALKGSDAHLVALLDSVGRPLGFHLGLANLTCTESGPADDPGYGRRGGCGWYTDDEEEDNDDDNVQMEAVEDTMVHIAHLVDMNGKLIRETIPYDVETEFIPDEIAEEITASHHDDQSYEGYLGNGAGCLERFYRRTALVIWPPSSHFDLIHGGRGFEYACKMVRASTSTRPTQEELALVNIVLSRCAGRSAEVISSVCQAALRWGDVTLWSRAVQMCHASVAVLKDDHIFQIIAAFGFAPVKSSLEGALRAESSNVRAIQTLDNLENWVGHQQSEDLIASAIPWIEAQRTTRFSELKEMAYDSSGPLITLVLKHKDIEFLEQSVLPIVKKSTNPQSLKGWAVDLHNVEAIPAEVRARMVKDVLSIAMSLVEFYNVQRPTTSTGYYGLRPTEGPEELKRAKEYVQACLDVDCEDLFALAVPKLLAFDGLQQHVIQLRVQEVILPLITYVSGAAGSRPVAGLSDLAEKVLALQLKATLADSRHISRADIAGMIQTASTCGKLDYFLTRIVPKLEALNLQETPLREIMDELHAKCALLDPSRSKIRPILLRLVKKWASIANLTAYHQSAYYRSQYVKPAIPVFDYCLTLRFPEVCGVVTKRLLNPAKLDTEYINNQLVPLLPDLSALLVKRQQPLSSPPFAPLFRTTMLHYTEKVLGPRPPDTLGKHLQALSKWTCGCEVCPAVRKFLTSEGVERREWHRIGAPKRRHLEQHLDLHARSLATYTMIRSTPQGLSVTKAKALIGPARWVEHQKKGLDMLKSISADPAVVKVVLGDDHAKISALLLGHPVANTPPQAGPSNANTASATTGRAAAVQPLAAPSRAVAHGAALGATRTSAATALNVNKRPHTSGPGAAQPYPAASAPRGVPAPTNATAGPSNAAAPPTKRRKTAYNEKDVIDLT